ncbi:hypothetical protein MPTK1_8g13460 [Marchantia polymorpha subsp. ruderalis]|uniref:BTB domain-containing protein n=1 Tax=Marchantia polymorpha TaxID=3197 RepID=A0A2R6WCE8_MARPO|nr:hypothetical protein MARPO_0110s0027 [Marchantia polymorpha]BBN19766.1 hypothetical protein Mp_8g13460 [Marchantia polymorpha subsp. ruderalis]|eukprot:PTQ31534.1 hypothetical protein MARPO_0110s0027 [Marchantia polymorpha]
MECPKCYEQFACKICRPHLKDFKTPRCENCEKRHKREVLEVWNRVRQEESDYKLVQSRLSKRLAFLKLQDPDSSMEIFKGDVAFVVHGCDMIHAHRYILAGKSAVFCRMFDCGMLEKETGLIPIDDASYPVMRAVINYCYTADINFTDEIPPDEVLKVAHKYEISHLRDVCAEELCGRISAKNITEMFRLSKRYDAKTLQEACAKYFKDDFDYVFSTVMENL